MTSAEVRKLWVDALRSGKYQQGKGTLESNPPRGEEPQFCCLGVLCRLAYEHNVIARKIENNIVYYDNIAHAASRKVRAWSGLATHNGEFWTENRIRKTLAGLNDTNNWDFERIANLIESDPAGLFDPS